MAAESEHVEPQFGFQSLACGYGPFIDDIVRFICPNAKLLHLVPVDARLRTGNKPVPGHPIRSATRVRHFSCSATITMPKHRL